MKLHPKTPRTLVCGKMNRNRLSSSRRANPVATTTRPSVFIGSSSKALPVAEQIGSIIRRSAQAHVWNSSFSPGEWTLQVLLDHAQHSDFGIFVLARDDNSIINAKALWTVRDNVLFEAGVFMGALGPKRTFLLRPSDAEGLRLPSDLEGLTTVMYNKRLFRQAAPLKRMVTVIKTMGPALRSSYNELAVLKQLLSEREQVFSKGSSASFTEIIGPIAAKRTRPWFIRTPVRILMDAISRRYKDKYVDDLFWWLIVDGIVTFDNIEVWTSDDSWHWDDSVDYAVFTERGVALLNQFRSERVLNR